MGYFQMNSWADVILLAIQPRSMTLGEDLSVDVKSAADKFIKKFSSSLEGERA